MQKNEKIKNAVFVEYDNIKFRSKLELRMYKELEEIGIEFKYEPFTIVLEDKFVSDVPFYIRKKAKKKKAAFMNTAPCAFRPVTYTPDFVFKVGDKTILLEAKGFENDVYPLKRKLLFKKLSELNKNGNNYVFAQVKTLNELHELLKLLNYGITK